MVIKSTTGYRKKGKKGDSIHIAPFGSDRQRILFSGKTVGEDKDVEVFVKGTYFKIEIPQNSDFCKITWEEGFGGVPEDIKKESEVINISKPFMRWLLCLKHKEDSDSEPLTKKESHNIHKRLRKIINYAHNLGAAY